MDNLYEWYNLIGNIGFPIVIAIYLLIRFEKRIDALKDSIRELEQTVREIKRDSR
jgi:hypothetical protein